MRWVVRFLRHGCGLRELRVGGRMMVMVMMMVGGGGKRRTCELG